MVSIYAPLEPNLQMTYHLVLIYYAIRLLSDNYKNVIHFVRAWFETEWNRVTRIYVTKLTIIGTDNGLSPEWCQAIILTSACTLIIGPLGTNVSEILIGIQMFSFKEVDLKVLSAK